MMSANCKLVHYAARRWRKLPAYEDIVQEGLIGLMKAVRTWDGRRCFTTYALTCIRREMGHYWTTRFSAYHDPRLESQIAHEDYSAALVDQRAREAYEAVDVAIDFARITRGLSEREREGMARVGWLGEDTRSIGYSWGYSYSRGHQIISGAWARLREECVYE